MPDEGGIDDAGPSDSWIAALICALRGWEPGTPVPAGLIASWRAHLRREVRRHAAARARGREPGPPPRRRRDAISAGEVIMDMLSSGEGQAAIALLAAMPALLRSIAASFAAAESYSVLVPSPRHRAAASYAYLVGKVGGKPWAAYWGRAEPRLVWRDGETARGQHSCDLGVPAVHRAAINAVTPARAVEWRRRLGSRSDAEVVAVLAEMEKAGHEAVGAATPLRIWDPEPGPPRGLLPDAPATSAPPAQSAPAPGDARGGA